MNLTSDGYAVRVDFLHGGRTYAGVLEGCPSPEDTIKRIRRDLKTSWGERPTLVIEPRITSNQAPPGVPEPWQHHYERRKLPEAWAAVWLNAEALDKSNDGSHLVLLWFADTEAHLLGATLPEVLASVRWAEHAQDYCI